MTASDAPQDELLAEIIAIGDELTSGQRLDTNSQWLAQQLGDIGIRPAFHTCVGDNLQWNLQVLRQAAQRCDFVICTGGLGPTLDDLTRQAMADSFDRTLVLDQESLDTINAMFAKRGREMPERNRIQAMFPSGSDVIPNPHGSAPGIDLVVESTRPSGKTRLFALPGVPAEMKQMWTETVAPRIESQLDVAAGPIRFHSVKLFGIGESDVEVLLPDLIHRERFPTVGITVSRATITLRIAGRAHSEEDFEALIKPTVAEIEAAAGHLIFGSGNDELQHSVLLQLQQHNKQLATAEVGSASWLNDWLLAADTSNGNYYAGGISLPSVESGLIWCEDLDQRDAQSVISELARSVKNRMNVDYGLAIGCYPSDSEMRNSKSTFEFFTSIATTEGTETDSFRMGGHPDVLGPRVAKNALNFLRKHLLQTRGN